MIEIRKMSRDWMTIIFVGSESGVTELMTHVLDSRISVTSVSLYGENNHFQTPRVSY